MNLSAPFIFRSVATMLINIGMLLLGVLCFKLLPVAPLPEMDFQLLLLMQICRELVQRLWQRP